MWLQNMLMASVPKRFLIDPLDVKDPDESTLNGYDQVLTTKDSTAF